MRVTYHAATSSDGFIAREDGDVSWLDSIEMDPQEAGLEIFFEQVDGLVMGRNTYDFVFDYGSWPYEDKPSWVCTHRPLERLENANLFVVDNIEAVLQEATENGLSHLWLVGGGALASGFLERNLITDICISEMPIELESGIALFKNHALEQLPAIEKSIIEKNGFRQIEIALQ